MAEEGLKKTRNELIHIGCPIPFEVETFLKELETLMDMAYPKVNEILFLHDMDVHEAKEIKYSNNEVPKEENTNNANGETIDISNGESGGKKLCDLKVESANDRW